MSFFDKLKRAFQKNKIRLIVFFLFMIVMLVMLVAPLSVMYANGRIKGIENTKSGQGNSGVLEFDFEECFNSVGQIAHPFDSIAKCLTTEYAPYFWGGTKIFVVVCGFFILVGIVRSLPKNEFTDIENGSSDWSTGGEQYRILSKKQGIILAEKNYLPVDKRGNVNVLVVRRFWCW